MLLCRQHAHLKYFLAIYENIEAAILGVRQEHGTRDKERPKERGKEGNGMRREGGRRRAIGRLEMKDEVWYVGMFQ